MSTTGLFRRISYRRRWIAVELLAAAVTALLVGGLAELLFVGRR